MNANTVIGGFAHNLIINTDSYKVGHWKQYPPGTRATFSYIESRGGLYPSTVFFGLQMFLKEYLTTRVTLDMVAEAKAFYVTHLPDVPFNEAGWLRIVQKHGGRLPLTIKAIPEGLEVPTGHVLVTVETTDPALPWLGPWMETAILRAVWYPTTVATGSRFIKQLIRGFLEKTADSLDGLDFKLHDFGARGVSSLESAALGGAAHLVNFQGSDTLSGVFAANRYYGAKMAAFSIAAAEHSTITAWGAEREVDAYRNMLEQFARPGSLVAVVSDSYDLYYAVEHLWGGALRQAVLDSGATLIVRPDSGDPTEVVLKTAELLDATFGSTANTKGYKVLKAVRIVQGDGVNADSIRAILEALTDAGFSADNVAFGMGGALLQQLDRDTQRFAMKTSAVEVFGEWRDVYKQPKTDPGKASKRGRLALMFNPASGEYRNASDLGVPPEGFINLMQTVYHNGAFPRDCTLDEVRANTERGAPDLRNPATVAA